MGIDFEFQHRFKGLFKRTFKSIYCSNEVFASPLEALTLVRIAGKTLKTLVIDLSDYIDIFAEDVLRYVMHDLT